MFSSRARRAACKQGDGMYAIKSGWAGHLVGKAETEESKARKANAEAKRLAELEGPFVHSFLLQQTSAAQARFLGGARPSPLQQDVVPPL